MGDRRSRGNDERGNGEGATSDPAALIDIFFQGEMPYDGPSQAAWGQRAPPEPATRRRARD
ncbi:MAG: hypothetical protein ACREOY_00405, partial [Candidatus Dormibacteraceae bacterium]